MTTIHDDLRDHMLAVERELMQVKRERDEALQALGYYSDEGRQEAIDARDRLRAERDSARQAFAAADAERHKAVLERQEALAWAKRLRLVLRNAVTVLEASPESPDPLVAALAPVVVKDAKAVLAGNLEGS